MAKITDNSQILTRQEAMKLVIHYTTNTIFDTTFDARHFKKFISDKFVNIVKVKKYYNEAGIRAMGELLTKEVETEVAVSSDADGRKRYRCVKFNDGTFACTCTSYLTYHNVTSPRSWCKHLKVLIDKGTF